ncbi:AT hook motif DNA-binding family protein [Medicago truncatula]|nr:AT hook motif DNA-binding family protein [Medicago truncatula]
MHNNNVSVGSPQQLVTTNTLPQEMNMNISVGNSIVTTIGTSIVALEAPTVTPTTTTPGSLDLFGKKKRGRPRKYDADGNLNPSYKKIVKTTTPILTSPPGFTLSTNEFASKKGRGKSTGFVNYQTFSSFGEVFPSTAAVDFAPHVVTVYAGEDVGGKILSFAQKSPRGICILSANGAISKVALGQPGSTGGSILTYEGRFEILSLSGSYTASDNSGIRTREGGLSVSLAGPDGRVIGGAVAGVLIAAGPIQIVVGSFMSNGNNSKPLKRKYQREQTVASPTSTGPEIVTAARPISQANIHGENFMIPIMSHQLPDQIQRESINVSSDKLNLDATPDDDTWNSSDEYSDQRTSPDINISLPDE